MIWKLPCHQPVFHLHSNCFCLVYTYESFFSVCNHPRGFYDFSPDMEQISETNSSIWPYQIGFDRDLTSFQFHDTCCIFFNFQRLPFENSDVNKYFVLSFKPALQSNSNFRISTWLFIWFISNIRIFHANSFVICATNKPLNCRKYLFYG